MVQPFPMQGKYMKKMKYISIHKNEISIYIYIFIVTLISIHINIKIVY